MSDNAEGTGDQTNLPGTNAEGQTPPANTPPAEGQGQGQNQPNTPQVPDQYQFNMPEGMELDKARADEFSAVAKELKLPQEAAQKLVDLYAKSEQQRVEQWEQQKQAWADEIRKDAEIGGPKLEANLAIAKKAIDLGPPELRDLLNSTGLGNHPLVMKWCLKVGQALSEDRFERGQEQSTPNDPAKRLFPTMN